MKKARFILLILLFAACLNVAYAQGAQARGTLPPITGGYNQYQSQTAQPMRMSPSMSAYPTQTVRLPPVNTLPTISNTTLPPLYSEDILSSPVNDAVPRVLGATLDGYTGLIHTVSADVSNETSFKLGFHANWFDIDRVYDRQLSNNESGDMLTLPIFFNYAVTDDLEVVFKLPVVDYTVRSRILWANDVSESGLGDSNLGFKYRVFDNPEFQMRGAVGVDFKFPTGSDDKGLGTGETDFTVFTAFSKNFEKIIAHLNLGYTMTGDPNTAFYPNGLADKFFYNIGIEYPHTEGVSVMAELVGEDWGAEGIKVDIVPGLRYTPTENFSCDLAVPVTITNDQRYGTNYRVVFGMTLFFR
ncbi:MAG: transporter [Candidatus Riflebacteria bacterium]|nr:transporter [Candidatus Riflebacteria bacterium]